MRLQLIVPENTMIEPEIFNRLLSIAPVTLRRPRRDPARARADRLHRAAADRRPRGRASRACNQLSYWLYLVGGVTLYAQLPLHGARERHDGAAAALGHRVHALQRHRRLDRRHRAGDARVRLLRDQPGRHAEPAARARASPGGGCRCSPGRRP